MTLEVGGQGTYGSGMLDFEKLFKMSFQDGLHGM